MNLTKNELKKLLNLLVVRKSKIDMIRVGRDYDGGYLVPNDLAVINSVISAGIADDVSFDNFFAKRGVNVYQYDPTIEIVPPSEYSDHFFFERKAFGLYLGKMGVNFDEAIKNNNLNDQDGKVLAKFDVEGGEYSAILSSSDSSISKFRCLVGEFHEINSIDNPDVYHTIISTLEKLNKNFFISHIHVNSDSNVKLIHGIPIPSLLEITYLNNRYYEKTDDLVFSGLHELDQTNIRDKPQIPWNAAWYLI
jgi:hypothetical protein